VWLDLINGTNLTKRQQEVKRKIHAGYFNVNKEIADILSRFMTRTSYPKEVFTKMIEEFKDKFALDMSEYLPNPIEEEVGDLDGKGYLYNLGDQWQFRYKYLMDFSAYSPEINYLVRRYVEEVEAMSAVDALTIALSYYNFHSSSGSNWSPSEPHKLIPHFRAKGFTVIECFASPFNNMNALTWIHKKKEDIHSDIVFTVNPPDRKIPEIQGTFPDSLEETVNSIEGDILLLVNPIFTEDVLVESFRAVYHMYHEYPENWERMTAFYTLPIWDDLYESEPCITYLKYMNPQKHKFTKSMVENFYAHKEVGLKYYFLIVNDLLDKR
jgi:hypothetical protein